MAVAPKKIQQIAKKGLEERKKYSDVKNKPGTDVGVARARDIANGKDLSEETIKRMKSFLARHEKNNKPGERDSKGRLSRGTVSYMLWGGEEAKDWVDKVIEKLVEKNNG